MSQFAFLAPDFAEAHEHAARAESLAHADPRASSFYARFALEVMIKWLYRHDPSLKDPFETTLSAHIHEPTFQKLLGSPLIAKAKIVKDLGNRAVHDAKPVAFAQAVTCLRELFHLSFWLARTYGRAARPDPSLSFSLDALPRTSSIPVSNLRQLQEVARRYADTIKARDEADARRMASETEREKLEKEIAALRAEVAATRKANEKDLGAHDYDEATTRDAFIDLLLREAGWAFTKPGFDTEYPVKGMPNTTGDGVVDYVLWGDNGKPLGIVEAKRTMRDARVGQQQAKLYADCLEAETSQRPVIFYTNGYEHWIWDDRRYPPRPIQGFLTKDELELAIRRRATLKPLSSLEINRDIVERFYQTRAIRRVAESFEKDQLRRALLVMATGAGKTRTVIALSDILMRANWARRILFLADRVALVNQAVNAFKRFLPESSPVNLVTEKTASGRVYVSTYPTMMKLIDEANDSKRRFGPGHFDMIVIDEAHRSVYRKYGAIFDYFDALIVGLTATPKAEIDYDTYRLFNLQRGVPTDAYGLDEAVKDGFLVPFKAISVPLRIPQDGIVYENLSDDEKAEWDAIEWDEDGDVPDRIEAAAVNQWLFNKDTVDKVLKHVMTRGLKVADGDQLAKTIIFAKNHNHAQFIAERFDANYPHMKGHFARVIDNKTEYAQSLIDDFSQPAKAPHIAIAVDMLDTGIDVPEAANLVFFKKVRSRTKFWQMIGRGTRLCPDLFGPGRHKEFFFIFDFCRNFEFFNQNPELADGAAGASLSKRLFAARVQILAELDAAKGAAREEGANGGYAQPPTPMLYASEPGSAVDEETRLSALRDAIAARLRSEVEGMSLENFIVRPKRRFVEKFGTAEAWRKIGLNEASELIDHVAGLPSSWADDDIAAKQFDMLILRTQLAVLRAEGAYEGLRARVMQIAARLEEYSNVPKVAAELVFLQEIQSDEYWQDITLPMLEEIRRRLRELVKLIDVKSRPLVFTDFEDDIGDGNEIVVQGAAVGTDVESFKRKARHFLKANENHIAILKLRRNEPLTPTDIAELERVFLSAGARPDEIEKVRKDGGLGLFVRSLVGLDREAAKGVLAEFTAGKALSADQIQFVNMVVDYLTERGTMEPRLLYESPFTDIDPMGVEGVFDRNESTRLVTILREVRRRTAA
jgi:type I restriction enzyme, R subunit